MTAIQTIKIDVVSDVTKFVAGFTKAGKQTQWFRDRAKAVGKSVDQMSASLSRFSGKQLKNLDRGLRMASKGFGKLKNSIASMVNPVGRFKGLIAGLVSVMAGRDFLRSMENLERIANKAQLLNLNVNSLRGLQFAAQSTSVSVQALEMAMQRMTRRIGEVSSTGKGEAAGTLARLGLDAKKLAGMRSDEQLLAIAKGLQRITVHSERLAAAQKLFDSEGVTLLNLLNEGPDKIRAFVDEANRLSGMLSADDVQRAKDFQLAWLKLSTALRGMKERFIIDIAPEATAAINALIDIQKKGGIGKAAADMAGKVGINSGAAGRIADRLSLANPVSFLFRNQGRMRGMWDRALSGRNQSAPAATPDEITAPRGSALNQKKPFKLPFSFSGFKRGVRGANSSLLSGLDNLAAGAQRPLTFFERFGSRFMGGMSHNEQVGREARKHRENMQKAGPIAALRGDSAEGFAALRSGMRQTTQKKALEIAGKQLGAQKDMLTLWREALRGAAKDTLEIEGA